MTLKRHRSSYGRWLGWLAAAGPARSGRAAPGARATPERVRAYVADLQALNAPAGVLVRLQSLAVVLGWLAPERDPDLAAADPGPAGRPAARPVRDKRSRCAAPTSWWPSASS